jgi:hypothetical protein
MTNFERDLIPMLAEITLWGCYMSEKEIMPAQETYEAKR